MEQVFRYRTVMSRGRPAEVGTLIGPDLYEYRVTRRLEDTTKGYKLRKVAVAVAGEYVNGKQKPPFISEQGLEDHQHVLPGQWAGCQAGRWIIWRSTSTSALSRAQFSDFIT